MGLGLRVVVVSVVEPLVARVFQNSDYLLSGACNKSTVQLKLKPFRIRFEKQQGVIGIGLG